MLDCNNSEAEIDEGIHWIWRWWGGSNNSNNSYPRHL